MGDSGRVKIVSILKEAIALEKDGEEYYKKAISRTTDPFSKNLLQRLSEDETSHGAMLAAKLKEIENEKYVSPVEGCIDDNILRGLKEIFPRDIDKIKNELIKNDENLSILKTAVDKEQLAVSLYSKALTEAEDSNLKQFLDFLLKMEQKHKELLSDYLNFLEEPVAGWDSMERWACQS